MVLYALSTNETLLIWYSVKRRFSEATDQGALSVARMGMWGSSFSVGMATLSD
jgi:hypothetical protein